jgi:hypothetical protein
MSRRSLRPSLLAYSAPRKTLPAPSYLSRVLRLTLLAPEIVEAILDGRQSAELQLDDLLAGLPLEWARQNECRASMAATGKDDRFDDS